jgi:hypothetical protein
LSGSAFFVSSGPVEFSRRPTLFLIFFYILFFHLILDVRIGSIFQLSYQICISIYFLPLFSLGLTTATLLVKVTYYKIKSENCLKKCETFQLLDVGGSDMGQIRALSLLGTTQHGGMRLCVDVPKS